MNPNISLVEMMKDFDTDEECREALIKLRWPNGVECPRCQSTKISTIQKRNQYDCDTCRYQFSVTSGTIFHDSHLPLYKWFFTIYLMCESKKGISANQISRSLKMSYKTAWYLCHRVRKAIEEEKRKAKLKGVVEVDETFIGGRFDARRKKGRKEQTPVVGLIQRGGKFESRKIPTTSKKILLGIIRDRISPEATIFTDDYVSYRDVSETHKHETVNHRRKEWVRDNVHTNTIENAWSLFKRSIMGSYHKISDKHLDAYLDEFEWRFNNRQNPFLFRDTLMKLIKAPKMEYQKLIAL
jgi:transposase-like protein